MKKLTHFNPINLVVISLFMLYTFSVQAFPTYNYTEGVTLFSSLYSEDVLQVRIETDINKLLENKKQDVYQGAVFTYMDRAGKSVQRNMKVKVRGKYRRSICDIPPIMMKFTKRQLTADGLKDDNKLKLVTHCFEEDVEESGQNVLKEFLAYKILNILTDKSYRVQLLRITYVDTNSDNQLERMGFIIESTSELEDRLESVSKDIYNLNKKELEPHQYCTVSTFQYMIGNTDWKVPIFKNITIFVSKLNKDEILIVPYDFDFSGLVNAKYALLNSDLNQLELRDRFFLGKFENEEQLIITLDLFRSKKEDIDLYIKEFKELKGTNRRDVWNYIKSFYKFIDDEELVINEFMSNKNLGLGY